MENLFNNIGVICSILSLIISIITLNKVMTINNHIKHEGNPEQNVGGLFNKVEQNNYKK